MLMLELTLFEKVSKLLFSLLSIIRIGINIIEVLDVRVVLLLIHKEIVIAFLEDLNLVFFEHYYIDATRSFECFIIIVEVIVDFNTQDETGKKEPVNIEVIEGEVIILGHVPVHDYNGDDETLG